MNIDDTTAVFEALKENKGCTVKSLCDVLDMTFKEVRARLRYLRDHEIAVCVGKGKTCGWYTVDYYLWNRQRLDRKHYVKPQTLKDPTSDNKRYNPDEDWCQKIKRLDQIMLRPS